MPLKRDDMMVCIGPAGHIRRDSHEAMTSLIDAVITLRVVLRATKRDAGTRARLHSKLAAAFNDIAIARELLEPIVEAIAGRGAPPPRKARPASIASPEAPSAGRPVLH